MSQDHKYISPGDAPAWHEVIENMRQGKLVDGEPVNWRSLLNERGAKEVQFAQVYAEQFAHGTTGHNQLMLINELRTVIDFILDNYMLTPQD